MIKIKPLALLLTILPILTSTSYASQNIKECEKYLKEDKNLCLQIDKPLANRVSAEKPLSGFVSKLRWSFDDKYLIANSYSGIMNAYSNEGKFLFQMSLDTGEKYLGFNPAMDIDETGRYLVSSNPKNIISLWDLRLAKLIGLYKASHAIDTLNFGDKTFINDSYAMTDNPLNKSPDNTYYMTKQPEVLFINGIENSKLHMTLIDLGDWSEEGTLNNVKSKIIYNYTINDKKYSSIIYSQPRYISHPKIMENNFKTFGTFTVDLVDSDDNAFEIKKDMSSDAKVSKHYSFQPSTKYFLGNPINMSAFHSQSLFSVVGGYGLVDTPNYRKLKNHGLIAVDSADKIILTTNISDESKTIREIKHSPMSSSLRFSHDGTKIALGTNGGIVRIFDVNTGQSIK